MDRVKTGGEALVKIQSREKRPHLLILDVMMDPGTVNGEHRNGTRTGIVVLEKIRVELNLDEESLPVICLTVLDDEELRKNVIALRADYFCKKNAKLSDIVAAVSRKTRSFR